MVRSLYQLCCWLFAVLIGSSSWAAAAAIQVQTDRSPLVAGDSFQLLFSSTQTIQSKPDFSVLQKDFELLDQRQENRVQSINGQRTQQQLWVVSLLARQSGTFTIPPIRFAALQSPAYTLTIHPAAAQAGGSSGEKADEDWFLEVSATPEKVLVQGQVVLAVRFFRAREVAGASLSEPQLTAEEAIVEKLGDDRSFESMRQGRRYQVVERRYALFPQKSGRLTIPPLRLDIQSGRRGLLSLLDDPFAGQGGEIKRRFSEAVEIGVQPIAEEAKKDPQWLPAHRLQLLEKWQESPPRLQVGESVTRTVTLLADGLTAAQLPELAPLAVAGQGDALKVYPDQPQLSDQRQPTGMIGMRQEKLALVPNKAGTITLPAIEIAWWNVDTQSRELARIPERTVSVAPAAMAASAPERQPEPVTASAPPPATKTAEQEGATARATPGHGDRYPAWLVPFLATGWGVTLLLWFGHLWRSRRQQNSAILPQAAVTVDPQVALRQACQADDAPACRTALLAWAQGRWPEQGLRNLNDLQRYWQKLGWSAQVEALQHLRQASFAAEGESWRGEPLWRLLEKLPHPLPQKGESCLPALYPG
ncbi:MAG: protein BatD [Magnetococcales bacterium]|nr:protein BatD [Magnetococcales bacterium]